MRTIVNYIRSLFCKHTFETEDTFTILIGKCGIEVIRQGMKRSIFCSKCGYHYNYWKNFN